MVSCRRLAGSSSATEAVPTTVAIRIPTTRSFAIRARSITAQVALLAIERRLFWQLNGFDPRYEPAYYEDTDLCFRVREAGLRVYVQPASVVVHVEGASSGTDVTTGVKRSQAVNREIFARRWEEVLARRSPPPERYDLATWWALADATSAAEDSARG